MCCRGMPVNKAQSRECGSGLLANSTQRKKWSDGFASVNSFFYQRLHKPMLRNSEDCSFVCKFKIEWYFKFELAIVLFARGKEIHLLSYLQFIAFAVKQNENLVLKRSCFKSVSSASRTFTIYIEWKNGENYYERDPIKWKFNVCLAQWIVPVEDSRRKGINILYTRMIIFLLAEPFLWIMRRLHVEEALL